MNNNNERYNPYNMNFNANSNNLGMGFRVGSGTGPMATGGEPTTSMMGGTGVHHTTMAEPQQAAAAAGNYGNQVNNGSHGGVRSSGMLPPSLLQKIDELIDRLNASSGHAVKNSNPSNNTNTNNTNTNTNNNNNNNSQPPPIRIICIGTNEGIPLSRSYGTPSTSNNLSEEMLSSLETFWNTVPSSVAPNVMTSSIAHQHQQLQQQQLQQKQQQQQSNDKTLPSYQPPHPLLHHIGMGPILKSTTIYYENCVYIQSHLSPLVITIITSPQYTNIGYIKSFALPILKELLEPIRLIVLKRRIDLSLVLSSAGNGGGGSGHGNGRVIAGSGGNGSGGHHHIVGLSITGDGSGNGSAGSGLHSYGNAGFL